MRFWFFNGKFLPDTGSSSIFIMVYLHSSITDGVGVSLPFILNIGDVSSKLSVFSLDKVPPNVLGGCVSLSKSNVFTLSFSSSILDLISDLEESSNERELFWIWELDWFVRFTAFAMFSISKPTMLESSVIYVLIIFKVNNRNRNDFNYQCSYLLLLLNTRFILRKELWVVVEDGATVRRFYCVGFGSWWVTLFG